MNTPVASLPAKLLACADEVESHPHPSHCEHLHVAYKLMREAAAALASPAPSAGVGVDDDEVSDVLAWLEQRRGTVMYDRTAALVRALQHPAAPSVSPAVGGPDLGLVAEMLDDLIYSDEFGTKAIGQYTVEAIREQARLCREADNATGEAVTVNRSPAGEGRLPEPDYLCAGTYQPAYSADQMRAYGEQCRLATPEQPDEARCAECDARLELVRPGKYQHPTCEQPGSALQGEPVVWITPEQLTQSADWREGTWPGVGKFSTHKSVSDGFTVPLYTTPPPAGAAEQGQCNHDEADVCPKCELRWRSLTERPAATQPEARGVEGVGRERIDYVVGKLHEHAAKADARRRAKTGHSDGVPSHTAMLVSETIDLIRILRGEK